jgi:thioredoxin reductase (NADPH)
MAEKIIYDLIIIGAGCAGASGAMYAGRMNLKTLMIAELPGGLITTTHIVENWPGIKSISGSDLASALIDHALSFGVPLVNEKVIDISKVPAVDGKKGGYIVTTGSNTYYGKAILFATGTKHKKLNVPGEDQFTNKGVSYCALCDAAFFKGKDVAIVGSGDSAAKEALLLSEHCRKVYMIIRGDRLKAEPVNFDRVMAKGKEKIEVRFKTEIKEIFGSKSVEKVSLNNGEELTLQGVFADIGQIPLSDLAKKLGVELNPKGEIVINRRSETNLPGVFAAGDVTDTVFKQAITGAAEAVTATYHAFEYLGKNEVVC